MKKTLTLLILSATGLSLFADPPSTHRIDRYRELYAKSAFTDPPPEVEDEPEVSDLPDWTLVGIEPYTNGVRVRLMNTKDRSLRVTIPSPEAEAQGFKLKEVNQQRSYLDSSVIVQKGNATGEVVFDPKFLVLKAVPAPSGANRAKNNSKDNRSNNTKRGSQGQPPVPGAGGKGTPPKPGAPKANGTQVNTTGNANSRANSTTTKSTTSSKEKRRPRYVPRPK